MAEHHDCATCTCFHRAPMQGDRRGTKAERADGSIAWFEHLEAHANYGHSQSAERIAERGGFGYDEFTTMVGREPRTWRPGRVRWEAPAKVERARSRNAPLHERISFALGLRPNREDDELVEHVLGLRAALDATRAERDRLLYVRVVVGDGVWCPACGKTINEELDVENIRQCHGDDGCGTVRHLDCSIAPDGDDRATVLRELRVESVADAKRGVAEAMETAEGGLLSPEQAADFTQRLIEKARDMPRADTLATAEEGRGAVAFDIYCLAGKAGCDYHNCEADAVFVVAFRLAVPGWVMRAHFCEEHAEPHRQALDTTAKKAGRE